MAVVYPLSLPSDKKFRQSAWRQVDVTADMASPFTGQSQTVDWGGRWFACTLTLVAMRDSDAAAWNAWLASLFGQTGTFLMGCPWRNYALGSARWAAGTPLVNGAVAAGSNTLSIDGLPASAATWLKAGDFLQVGSGSTSRLQMVLGDVASNGSGQATFDIWPGTREALADNAAIVVAAPKSVWQRVSPATEWVVGADRISRERSFDVKEYLGPSS